jgi:hypothetical protein
MQGRRHGALERAEHAVDRAAIRRALGERRERAGELGDVGESLLRLLREAAIDDRRRAGVTIDSDWCGSVAIAPSAR